MPLIDNATNVIPFIRYSGVFDFDGLYKMMYNWFFKQRYEFHEKLYKDKVSTPLGMELEVKWEAHKKITEFIQFWIYVEFHLWDVSEVEVIKNGHKVKMTRCRMQIKFTGETKMDYANRFEENETSKKLFTILTEKIMNKDIEFLYTDRLTYIIYELHAEVKKFLGTDTSSNAW